MFSVHFKLIESFKLNKGWSGFASFNNRTDIPDRSIYNASALSTKYGNSVSERI